MVTAEKRTLQIEARMKDFLSRDLGKVEKALVRVGVYGGRSIKGLVSATFSLRSAITGLLAGYTALQGVQLVRRFGEEADAILKLASSTGDLVENLSELQAALALAGVKAADFDVTLKSLVTQQRKAIDGNADAAVAFHDLGISLDDLQRLAPSQLFEEIARGLGNISDEQERALALSRLLPKQFLQLLPLVGGGIEKFQAAIKEAREAGATITEQQARIAERLNDAFSKVEIAVGGVARALTEAFGPRAIALLEKLARTITQNRDGIVAIAEAIGKGIVRSVNLAIDAIIGLVGAIESIPGISLIDEDALSREIGKVQTALRKIQEARDPGSTVRRPSAFGGGPLATAGPDFASAVRFAEDQEFGRAVAANREQILRDLVPQEPELRRKLATLQDTLNKGLAGAMRDVRTQLSAELDAAVQEIRSSTAPLSPDEAAAAVGLPPGGAWEDYAKNFGKAMSDVQKARESVFRDAKAKPLPTEDGETKVDRRPQRLALLQQIGSLAGDLDAVQDALRGIEREQIALTLEQATREGIINADELAAALAFVNEQFARMQSTIGGGDFFDGFRREAKAALRAWTDFTAAGKEAAATLIDNGLNGLTDAFADIITGTKSAKEAFKDFAKAMLADLARILSKLVVMATLRAVLGLEDGGVVPFEEGGVRKFATGGVNRNGGVARRPTVLFGEGRTAEAFVPLPDNRSIPVSFVGGDRGGASNVLITIHAMDSRDVQRMLFEQQGTLRTIFTNQLETKHGMRQVVRRAAS